MNALVDAVGMVADKKLIALYFYSYVLFWFFVIK